jgi:hypothetical protein
MERENLHRGNTEKGNVWIGDRDREKKAWREEALSEETWHIVRGDGER